MALVTLLTEELGNAGKIYWALMELEQHMFVNLRMLCCDLNTMNCRTSTILRMWLILLEDLAHNDGQWLKLITIIQDLLEVSYEHSYTCS